MNKQSESSQKSTGKDGETRRDRLFRQLRETQQFLDNVESVSPDEQKRILNSRAAKFAGKPPETPVGETLEILEFQLGNESYGLEPEFIQEVVPLNDFTPVPGTPDHILGVTGVRGKIYSVLILKKIFQLPDKGLTDLNKLIILQSGEMEFGILADRIVDIKRIRKIDIRSPDQVQSPDTAKYITGVTSGHLILVNAEKLLDDYGKLHQENSENLQ